MQIRTVFRKEPGAGGATILFAWEQLEEGLACSQETARMGKIRVGNQAA